MGRIAGVTAKETRDRLVRAAASVFADHGYEGARVNDIAREAGLTTGAIYAHYRTKAELLAEAVRARGGAELASLLGGQGGGALGEVFQQMGESLAGKGPGRRGSTLLVEAVAAARRDPEVARLLRDGVADRESVVAAVIEQAIDTDVVDDSLDPATLARFAVTLALGSLLVRVLDLTPVDATEWSSLVRRLISAIEPNGAVR